MLRQTSETWIITALIKCQRHPLSQAQADYLTSRTEYGAQRYLMALDADPVCALQAIRACEAVKPGDCIAVPGERDGRRP